MSILPDKPAAFIMAWQILSKPVGWSLQFPAFTILYCDTLFASNEKVQPSLGGFSQRILNGIDQ